MLEICFESMRSAINFVWRLSIDILFSRDFEACFDLKHEFFTKMGEICWRLSLLAGVMMEICWRYSFKMRWRWEKRQKMMTLVTLLFHYLGVLETSMCYLQLFDTFNCEKYIPLQFLCVDKIEMTTPCKNVFKISKVKKNFLYHFTYRRSQRRVIEILKHWNIVSFLNFLWRLTTVTLSLKKLDWKWLKSWRVAKMFADELIALFLVSLSIICAALALLITRASK